MVLYLFYKAHHEIWRMSTLFDTVQEYFQKNNWNPMPVQEGQPILRMGFAGRNGKWTCYAQVREDEAAQLQQFLFYSVLPANAPEDKRDVSAEFITRANYTLVIGGFEMDYTDGELRYKTSINLAGTGLIATAGLIQALVVPNILTVDQFLPGLMSVLYGGASPADAVAKILMANRT
jgi:hypothetical protein